MSPAPTPRPGAWLRTVARLGVKELRSLWRDRLLLLLVVWAFSGGIYSAASSAPDTLRRAAIAVVDEDQTPLSQRIGTAFYPPSFKVPEQVTAQRMDAGLDRGLYTFVLQIPSGFQRDVLAGRAPAMQLNVDATQMSQAFVGAASIERIALGEIAEFVRRDRVAASSPVELVLRLRFNPTLEPRWFMGVMQLINEITMLSIILTGAALIREREHGTLEHVLVLPVTPLQIMAGKVWAMGLVVLAAAALSLHFVVQGALHTPVAGSTALFLAGCALHLFAMTAMGIYMGTVARSMPQLGLLVILVLLPLQLLSGGSTPRESMPELVQNVMLMAPTTHFVRFAQAILYRGAGFSIVWPSFAAIGLIGVVFFTAAALRLRKSVSAQA